MDMLPNILQQPQNQQIIDYREIGATGLRRFSGFVYEEFLLELTGWKGVAIFKEMQYNDPVVAAVLFAINMLCRQCDFHVEAASQDNDDQEAADFMESCIADMSQSWADTLVEILSMIPYGYSAHEIVYKRRCGDSLDPSMRSQYTDGRIGWRKFPIRSQDTIYRWQFDDHGGIQGVEQLAPPHYYHVTIPVEKLLLFRTTTEKNNPEGRSALRGAYRPWYMKKNIENIEAIGIERDLAGLPMAFVPPEILSANANNQQKQILQSIKDITINVRRNEQEGLVFPMDYDQNGKLRYDFKLLTTGGSRQFDTDKVINRYDQRIAMTLLADFILLGQSKAGNRSIVETRTDLFAWAIGAFLDIVCDVINRYAVPRLFALNDFRIAKYPQLTHGGVGTVDLAALGQYVTQLSGSGLPLFPSVDGKLEQYLMQAANLPIGLQTKRKSKVQGNTTIPNNEGKTQVEIPSDGLQVPTATGISDRTPADGQPKVEQVTTNISGNTEDGSGRKNPQEENQYTKFGPQGRP